MIIKFPYFQQDDAPTGRPKKECTCNYYRVYVDGKRIKQGRHAIKQTKKIENRTILKRKWSVSKKQWKDDGWVLIMVMGKPCGGENINKHDLIEERKKL